MSDCAARTSHDVCGWKRAATPHLEPESDTPQSTRRFRSSQTPPHGSGGDTCPHPPTREGKTEKSGTHSSIDLRPGLPEISPERQEVDKEEEAFRDSSAAVCRNKFAVKICILHLLRAHVNTLIHRHVLDDCAVWKCQGDIVRPAETPLENGAPI